MEKSDKLFAINQTLPGLESFLREVLGKEGLSLDAEQQRQEFLKRLETISTPPALPPRPTRLAARAQFVNDSGSGKAEDEDDPFANSLYRNDTFDDPVAFASHQRELSRHYTKYSKGYVGRRELFGENSPLYVPQPTQPFPPEYRDSIQSCSSDEIYERLSLGEAAYKPSDSRSDFAEKETSTGTNKPAQDAVNTSVQSLGQRGGTGRGSGGKGKITTGWFKKETKPQTEVYLSDIQDPVIQGYLKDTKTNKRRWCVLKDEKLYIFKTRDDPTNQIIDLPNCHIGVDDKKKISYSFRLQQTGAPLVQLAIEEGHDLSPWMSAIMAAAVRRSKSYRPTSPLENTLSLEEAQGKAKSPYGYMRINIRQEEDMEEDGSRSTYEVPIELLPEMMSSYGYQPTTSTPTTTQPDTDKQPSYNPPLPPLPLNSDSSSETSSDDEEDYDDKEGIPNQSRKERKASKVNTCEGKDHGKSIDSAAQGERRSFHEDSHGTDSPSDQSTHRLSFGETMASDEASEPRGEMTGSSLRKRTSTVLSNVSLESAGSNQDLAQKQQTSRKSSLTTGPRMKRRRKQTSAESESKFLQDPDALHSGILFQKRPLGVWSKRYCKLISDKLKCYRHADDEKPSLTITLLDNDISLIDSKESKKSYAFRVGCPGMETYYFATDSRVSVERWIELLSLAATGRQDIMAPYPPYFKSGSGDERFKSQESLSEDVDSCGDALDYVDCSSTTTQTSRGDGYTYDDVSGFAADELDEDVSSDAREDHSTRPKNRNRRVKSPNRRSPRHYTSKGGARDRAMKRKKEKQSRKGSGPDSPSTISPPQSVFVSDSGGENKQDGGDETVPVTASENRVSAADPKKDKKKWAESLKLKQSRFSRGHSLSAIITGAPASEVSKTRLHTIKKTNIQSYSHLLSLFDKEGRFSGFLTEVKVSKYSRTQLRRWSVVKNGTLNLYNKQGEEIPAVKLNLAEMWLTDVIDESKHKYSFDLHEKDGKTYTFQVPSKEEFDKWYGILRVFTEIRVERPSQTSTVEESEKGPQQDRDSVKEKSDRPLSRDKDEGPSVNTFVKRPSIRMKFSQKVNVMDIFKRSHSSYDFENPVPGDIIPTEDIKCINFTGGQLTEVCVTEDHYTWSRARWCTIKNSELLIYADSGGVDPVKRVLLYNVRIEEACEPDKEVFRFKIHKAYDTLIFVANNKLDYERWVSQLKSATSMYGKGDHENSKCRIPSPRVFSHRRSRSETLPHILGSTPASGLSSSASSPEKRLSYGSTSVSTGSEGYTDTLMNGHLDEVVPNKKERRSKWCVVTSEFFFVYDWEDLATPTWKWKLPEVKFKEEHKDASSNSFGFCLQCGEEVTIFLHTDREVISQWLSVLYRYCEPIKDNISPMLSRRDSGYYKPRMSQSHDNIKTESSDQEKRFLRKTLSEGKVSGRKLFRKISEDNLLHKYRRAELFKIPWKGSFEKLSVKFRDQPETPSVNARDLERRFSCGSLFDNEGKYSGYLVELVTRPLCRSEVRRWCVLRDNFYVYEQPRTEPPRKIISMKHVELINEGNIEESKFVFRLDYGSDESAVFRALSRTDFEKWVTAISVKLAVLKARIDRQERRRGFVIDEDEEPNHSDKESTVPASTCITPSTEVATDNNISNPSNNTEYLGAYPRKQSNVSNDSVFIREQVTSDNTASDKTTDAEDQGGDDSSSRQNTGETDISEKSEPSESVSAISEGLENIKLHDFYAENKDDVINLGSFKIPWSAVLETEREMKEDIENEPVYQNTGSGSAGTNEPIYQNSGSGSAGTDEPIYQNNLGVISEVNRGTLSSLQVEEIDLNSHNGRMNYRRFREGFLSNQEESMFIDMLPKRHSEYDLGPLYDNIHLLPNQDLPGKPVWSARSKEHDEEFVGNTNNSIKSPKEFNSMDRRSMASDYSGIVGESLLEEVGSVNTSRSGTLSSQASGVDPRDLQAMNSAFDKELLGDILGLNVTTEEAAEISEFCAKCDEEQDYSLSTIDTRSDTLTNRHSKSDVFFDASSEFSNENPNSDSNNKTFDSFGEISAHEQVGRDLRSSSGGSVHDTYFGRSSSDDDDDDEVYEDSSQGFLTAESSPCHKPLSATVNKDLLNEDQFRILESESQYKSTTGFMDDIDRRSKGESSEEEHLSTYFGKSSSESEDYSPDVTTKYNKVIDPLEQLREDEESIVSVGAVLPSDDKDAFLSPQSRFENCLDNSKTTNEQTGKSDQSVSDQDKLICKTNSNEANEDNQTVKLRNKAGQAATSERKELTKSQAESIKAVTDAFEDITNLSFDNDGSEDTKL